MTLNFVLPDDIIHEDMLYILYTHKSYHLLLIIRHFEILKAFFYEKMRFHI